MQLYACIVLEGIQSTVCHCTSSLSLGKILLTICWVNKYFCIQFPDSAPTLPAELAELSFDEDDFEDNDDEEEEDDEEDEEEEEERDESNRSETSDDNEGGDRQNEDEEVTTATEDEEAGDVDDDTVAVVATALKRNRLLELEGQFLD